MRKPFLAVLCLVCSLSWSQTVDTRIAKVENGLNLQSIVSPRKDILTFNILKRLEENKIHGASVAVVNEGKIEWSKAYGLKEFGKSDPVTTATLFQCASIGKVITAMAILQLVEQGKIDLDENINNKLKRWKIKGNKYTESQKVTLRHLLSHSAGLTDEYGFLGYDPKKEIPTLLQILNNDPLANTKKVLEINAVPGTVERYSGGGYLILQLLIEDSSGLSYVDYVQQHIFDSLEMSHSTYENQPDKTLKVPIAVGHRSNGKSLKNKKYHIYPEKAAAGPWTTAEDLAKLIVGIQNSLNGTSNAILDQELTQEFLTAQINNKGLGVNLRGVEKPEAFWHAGQNLGYTALFYGLVEKGKGAVILLNSDGGERLMQEFMTSVSTEYDWPVMQSYTSLEIQKELKSELVGNYASTDGVKELSIEERKGALVVVPSDSKKGVQLYRIGDNQYTFLNAQDYYKLSFHIEDNTLTLVYSESMGKTIHLRKIK